MGHVRVNVVGSLLLGFLTGALPRRAERLACRWSGPGSAAALTTYSTFSFETVRLAQEGSLLESSLNVLTSVAAALTACTAGWALGAALG